MTLTTTLAAVEVEVVFPDNALSGIDEQSLQMVHWDGTKWVTVGLCDSCGLQPPNRYIIRISNFSEFAWVGRGKVFVPSLHH